MDRRRRPFFFFMTKLFDQSLGGMLIPYKFLNADLQALSM